MNSNIFEGVWEDVAVKHADALKGQRVEVRLIDQTSGSPTVHGSNVWAVFEKAVGKVTRGKRLPGSKLLTTEDFYESRK